MLLYNSGANFLSYSRPSSCILDFDNKQLFFNARAVSPEVYFGSFAAKLPCAVCCDEVVYLSAFGRIYNDCSVDNHKRARVTRFITLYVPRNCLCVLIETGSSLKLLKFVEYIMAKVQLANVAVLDNPSPFLNPFQFEVTFECIEELKEGTNFDFANMIRSVTLLFYILL